MPKKEGYIDQDTGEVVEGSGKAVKDISDKVAEAENQYVEIPRRALKKLSQLEPEKQERYLSKLLGKHQSKNVRVPVRQLEDALHYLMHTRGYRPGLVESLLQKDIDYGSPQLKRLVHGMAHKAEESRGEYLKLPRKELKKVAKLTPEKQEKKLKAYLEKSQSKYAEVPREEIIDMLEHLREERGEYMSPLERLAYRSAAVLLAIGALGLIGAPAITGFAVSSTVDSWSLRVPLALLLLSAACYIFVKKR